MTPPYHVPPATLDALQDAVGFAAEGKPLSVNFLSTLAHLLSNIQERSDMVQVVVAGHQMSRLADTFRRISLVEGFLFDNEEEEMSFETQMKKMDPELRVKILTLLYKEAGALVRYQSNQRGKAAPTSPSNAIEDASLPISPGQVAAQHSSRQIGTDGREKIRQFIGNLLRGPVIDAETETVE